MDDSEIIKIPAERVKALNGENGSTRRIIEKRCSIKLTVDSDGDVQIEGDASDVFFARDVVKAIGRGFSPEHALRLLDHDFGLYIIQLKDVASSDKALVRLKGRVIGEKGRIKARIEQATDSFLSVYGTTVSIIARIDTMEYAKEAVGMLLDGARHSTVLNYLSKSQREILESRLKGT